MTAIDDSLSANAAAAAPRGDLSAEPARRLAVLTCMDARLDPLRDLGLDVGDAHVIRNAGGRATDDALRSLLLSWHALGTREVLVVHHTRCGVKTDDASTTRAELEQRAGVDLADIELHTFADDEESIRTDVRTIAGAPFAPEGLVVRGALHDVDTGRVEEIG